MHRRPTARTPAQPATATAAWTTAKAIVCSRNEPARSLLKSTSVPSKSAWSGAPTFQVPTPTPDTISKQLQVNTPSPVASTTRRGRSPPRTARPQPRLAKRCLVAAPALLELRTTSARRRRARPRPILPAQRRCGDRRARMNMRQARRSQYRAKRRCSDRRARMNTTQGPNARDAAQAPLQRAETLPCRPPRTRDGCFDADTLEVASDATV